MQDLFSRGYGQLSESVKAGFDNYLEHNAHRGPIKVISAEGLLNVADNPCRLLDQPNRTTLLTVIPIEGKGQLLEKDTYAALLLVGEADINQKDASDGYMSSSMAIFTLTG